MSRAAAVAAVAAVVAACVAARATALPAPQCAASRLSLAATFYGEAGGQFMQTLTFRNRGGTSCRLAGWPRLVGVASRRVVQGRRTARPYGVVVLRPHRAASLDVFGADWDAFHDRACPTLRTLRVTLPRGGAAFRVAVRVPDCPAGFFVAPLVAGARDRGAWSFVWRG
jgi:hypothetical protein